MVKGTCPQIVWLFHMLFAIGNGKWLVSQDTEKNRLSQVEAKVSHSVTRLSLTGHFPTQWMALSRLATPLTAELELTRKSTGSWNWLFLLYFWYIDTLSPSCHCQTWTIANLRFFLLPLRQVTEINTRLYCLSLLDDNKSDWITCRGYIVVKGRDYFELQAKTYTKDFYTKRFLGSLWLRGSSSYIPPPDWPNLFTCSCTEAADKETLRRPEAI